MRTPKSTADLVLHPVRLRIIQALLGDRRLTTAQIAEELRDVSTATLYRQVAALVEGGVLEVAEERRVRGAVERTYRLHVEAAQVTLEDLARMTPEEHKQAFASFVAGLLADFDAYADRGDIDFVRDRVGYRQTALWLTDDELDNVLAQTRALHEPYLSRGPGDGRVRRVIASFVLPTFDEDNSHA